MIDACPAKLAIIGGTGLTQLKELKLIKRETLTTPYGAPSAEFITGELAGKEVIFLARHGNPHTIPPHKINYRANIWGLKQLGVENIVAVAAVGGISSAMIPAHIAIPDQLIDYSYGRTQTFFETDDYPVTHIDFTFPYHPPLRAVLCAATLVSVTANLIANFVKNVKEKKDKIILVGGGRKNKTLIKFLSKILNVNVKTKSISSGSRIETAVET